MSLWYFIFISLCTLIVFFLILSLLKDFNSKLFYTVFSFFFYFYNGIGLAFEEVSIRLRIYYLFFFIFFSITFVVVYRMKSPIQKPIEIYLSNVSFRSIKLVNFFAYTYVFLIFVNLIYPEFILSRLWHPPLPDLSGTLNDFERKDSSKIISKILFYLQTLFFPFFILHFDFLNKNKKIYYFLGLSFLLNYISFVKSAYISRSDILLNLQIATLSYFLLKQKIPKKSLTSITIVVFFFVIYFAMYQQIRLGKSDFGALSEVLSKAFETEVSFPRDVVQKLLDYEYQFEFSKFLVWIFTLPIPKIFIPNLISFELNKNISELILNISNDDQYFYILLPGTLGEGLFIYGKLYFLIHAIFCGTLFGFIMKAFKNLRMYPFLLAYLMALMSYYTARGGLVSSLPLLINGNILLFLYFAFLKRIRFKSKN